MYLVEIWSSPKRYAKYSLISLFFVFYQLFFSWFKKYKEDSEILLIHPLKYYLRRFNTTWQEKFSLWRLFCVMPTSL